MLDELQLSDADVDAVLGLIELHAPVQVPPERDTSAEREELQRRLAAGAISLNVFTRAMSRSVRKSSRPKSVRAAHWCAGKRPGIIPGL